MNINSRKLNSIIISSALFLSGLILTQASAAEKLQVVASFSILGDIVRQIGGDNIELTTLVDINSDAHVYQARPIDVKKVHEADLLVVNGLGFEGWIDRLEQSSGFSGRIVVATDHIDVLHVTEHLGDRHEHGNGGVLDADIDPHAWHSIKNVQQYAVNIALAFKEIDPQNDDYYDRNLLIYQGKLTKLENEITELVAQIPIEKRRVIASHDAFEYLAEAYGFQFLSPQGVSTESEASAKDVAELIRQIRSEGANAIFIENIADDRLMEQIARETDISIGGMLYSGALSGADEPAATYIEMMRYNITTLVTALKHSLQ